MFTRIKTILESRSLSVFDGVILSIAVIGTVVLITSTH